MCKKKQRNKSILLFSIQTKVYDALQLWAEVLTKKNTNIVIHTFTGIKCSLQIVET